MPRYRALQGYSVLSILLLFGACSRPQPAGVKPSRFSVTKLNGGPLTTYAPGNKKLVKEVPGSSIRRTFIILNDPASPIEITSFGFHVDNSLLSSYPSDCTPAVQLANPMDWRCAKLMYIVDWSIKTRASIAAWEVHNSVFDEMNRFLWDAKTANDARGSDAAGLEAGTEHKTDRVSWWNSTQTNNLGKWVTSVLYVGSVRTKDGKVWRCDEESLRAQIKSLSLEIPSDLKQGSRE